jgi:hypothetical protein
MSDPRSDIEIQRLVEETRKFVAEQHKLMEEAYKFTAETRKLDRDRWLAPALAIAAVVGGLLGTASFIAKVITG